ncbi:HesA/MoeB/ThiF family protein [Pseudodesulfovibrio sp. JC047]|uniref:HesA/MoeB/ThiF family protein n=1 Tax=Pseudodesulfovibrio sp. JC047 TaxID=2683199 RepID=UPI0013D1CDB4|nr:ThiF family adenylyltransferase [Pseudodesulfovibrio sp. JC047]NDV20023.1 HesA/MoeB/ThiF family protein [Pseudodesulfovibrio sp. JC047]
MKNLLAEIQASAKNSLLPWGETGAILPTADVSALATRHGMSGHDVERHALTEGIYPLRYLRNMQSFTTDAQINLLEATIAQVGLGGLGGNLLEQFLRMGVGTIRTADGDHFEESNLNRQELSTIETLNKSKARTAMVRATSVNPSVDFSATDTFLTTESLPEFLSGATVAIDALGGLESRLHLQKAAAQVGIPLVTGALAGWTGYVGVVMPGDIGPADIMGVDNEAEGILGCPAPAVALIASLMATQTFKVLTGDPSLMQQTMIIVDLATTTFETISI